MNSPKKTLFEVLDQANAFAALHHSDPGYAQMKVDVRMATREAMAELSSGDGLGDLLTHRDAWRSALELARDTDREKGVPSDADQSGFVPKHDDSLDGGSYWEHELRAFDRTFERIGKLQGVPTAIDPFADVRDKRLSELTPEQQDLAMELWVRNEIQSFDAQSRGRLEALLRVMDRLRGRAVQFPADEADHKPCAERQRS